MFRSELIPAFRQVLRSRCPRHGLSHMRRRLDDRLGQAIVGKRNPVEHLLDPWQVSLRLDNAVQSHGGFTRLDVYETAQEDVFTLC